MLTRHCRREQQRQRGKLTLVSILFRVQRTPNQTGSSGCFYQRGHCVQHNHSTVSLQPRSPTTLISNQPIPPPPSTKKPHTKAQRSKACSDYWLSGGLALRKGFLDKSRALGSCSRKKSTCLVDHSGPKQNKKVNYLSRLNSNNIFAQ